MIIVCKEWKPIEIAPKDKRILLWARLCGHPQDEPRVYLAEHDGERYGSTINGELMTGWMSVEGDVSSNEDGAWLERWELVPICWTPQPEPPSS